MSTCCPSCSKFTPTPFLSHSYSLLPSFFTAPFTSTTPFNNSQTLVLRSSHGCVPLLATTSCSNFESGDMLEAQIGVSKYLQELGVSEVESDSIVCNSPKYLRMLVSEVQEKDELSMWENNIDGFKEKVVLIARDKGDNGKVAYLESLGLSLSSAMNVARYLSAETLVNLILKV